MSVASSSLFVQFCYGYLIDSAAVVNVVNTKAGETD